MLPASYDKVSKETKKAVQLFMAHARGFLQGRGRSDEEARTILKNHETEAKCSVIKTALENWEESRRPCSAEQFVQWFAELVWDRLTGDDDIPFPYNFTAPVVGGPLSTEFLEAIGKTEAEVLGMIKKEENPEEGTELALHTIPAFVKTETSPPGSPNAPPALTNTLAQRVKVEPRSPDNTSILGKRQNDEPDATTRKHRRGNDGQRVPSASRGTNRTDVPWSGVPLTTTTVRSMNFGLMNEIWWMDPSMKADPDSVHRGWMFEVKIPKEKAWLLLGQDIHDVFRLLGRRWYPIRLHTYELDAFLHVGLWVLQSQTQGHVADVVRQKLPTLLRLLKRWSAQAQGNGKAESLKDFLANH